MNKIVPKFIPLFIRNNQDQQMLLNNLSIYTSNNWPVHKLFKKEYKNIVIEIASIRSKSYQEY